MGSLDVAAQRFEESGYQINRLYKLREDSSTPSVCCRAGVNDDHWRAYRFLVESVLVAHPVITHVVAMVRAEHDHRVLEAAHLFHLGE